MYNISYARMLLQISGAFTMGKLKSFYFVV